MECYFGTYERPDGKGKKKRLVCFSIPSKGIAFKAPFNGEKLHTEYASLLTLLEFIELNQKLFKGKKLKIYGDDFELIKQIESNSCKLEFCELLKKALEYRRKYKFSLGWVPKDNNPSTNYLFD